MVALAMAVLVAGAACASGARPVLTDQVGVTEPADQAKWDFVPKEIRVPKGTTVTWTNGGKEFHSVTSDDEGRPFDKGVNPGTQATVTFERAGDFRYHCGVHPQMTGIVHVCDGPCT
jgi:plastocyanin